MDPIGEAGGMNLYGYVGNDPVHMWDPLGLACISISTNKGKSYKATNPSNASVRKFLKSLAPGEKIRNLEINGHGFSQGININDQTGDGLEMGLTILPSGATMEPAQWSDTSLPIAPDFAGHTDSDTKVHLDGCNTGNTRNWLWGNTNNLGKAVSKSLKDATVTGLRGPGWISNPVTGNANHVSGLPRRYKNGKIK